MAAPKISLCRQNLLTASSQRLKLPDDQGEGEEVGLFGVTATKHIDSDPRRWLGGRTPFGPFEFLHILLLWQKRTGKSACATSGTATPGCAQRGDARLPREMYKLQGAERRSALRRAQNVSPSKNEFTPERTREQQWTCYRRYTVGVSPTRERILAMGAQYITAAGMILPPAYVIPIALSEISGYFGRLDLLAWMGDLAMLLSLPWELIATVLIVVRWRDLSQRFWILYFVNGFLAYISLPLYRMHFGLYR